MAVVAKETFVADDNLVSLEAVTTTGANGKMIIRLLGLTRHGEANIWDYSPNKKGFKKGGKAGQNKPIQPSSRIRCKTSKNKSISFNAVTLASDSVALTFINSLLPHFEVVNYYDQSKHSFIQSAVVTLQDNIVEEKQKEEEKEDYKIVDSFAEISSKFSTDEPQQESFISDASVQSRYPTSSLSNALDLVLNTKDPKREDEVLTTTDVTIVDNTIQRLVPAKAEQLLGILVSRLKTRPASINATCIWLKSLLSYHLSNFLRQSFEVQQQIRLARAFIENRLRSQNKLESVAGRLDLIMTQINKSSSIAITRDFNDFVEGEESEEESEDVELSSQDNEDEDEDNDEDIGEDEDIDDDADLDDLMDELNA